MTYGGRIDVQIRDEDVLITMSGEMDFLVTSEFDMYKELNPARGRPVRFDLGGVTFLDSRGIAELLTARNFAPQVELLDAPPVVRRLLEIAGITSLFSYGGTARAQ